jgi:hypothetical protein
MIHPPAMMMVISAATEVAEAQTEALTPTTLWRLATPNHHR